MLKLTGNKALFCRFSHGMLFRRNIQKSFWGRYFDFENSFFSPDGNDEKKFYDIGYYLTQTSDDNSEDKGFIVTGNKSNELDSISWIKS